MPGLAVGKDDVRRVVADGLGPILVEHGFRALPSGLRFKRAIPEGRQEVDVVLAMNPPYARGKIHVVPQYTWCLPKVGALCKEMVGGNPRIGRIDDVVFWGQLAPLSYLQEHADWYFEDLSQSPKLSWQQAEFFSRWVVPFCDEYRSAEDFVRGYFAKDSRLALNLYEVPSVAAALVILGRSDEARVLVQANLKKAEDQHYSLQPMLDHISTRAI